MPTDKVGRTQASVFTFSKTRIHIFTETQKTKSKMILLYWVSTVTFGTASPEPTNHTSHGPPPASSTQLGPAPRLVGKGRKVHWTWRNLLDLWIQWSLLHQSSLPGPINPLTTCSPSLPPSIHPLSRAFFLSLVSQTNPRTDQVLPAFSLASASRCDREPFSLSLSIHHSLSRSVSL